MSCISVILDIEDVAATGEIMVRSLNLCLVLRRTFIIYRHMVGVCVVVLVCYARDDAELLAVESCETARKSLCRSCKHTEVMSVFLAVLANLVLHEGNDAQTEFLSLCRLSMMLSAKSDKRFGKSDESDTESTVVDDCLDGVILSEFLAVQPERTHEKRELLLHSGLLEVESLVELLCSNVKSPSEFVEELVDSVLLVLDAHALDCELHDIDCSE